VLADDDLRHDGTDPSLALHAARLGAWDWDVHANRIEWDERHVEVFGRALRRDERTLEGFLGRVHHDDRSGVAGAMAGAVERGGVYEREHRVVRDDGEVRWVLARGHAVPGGAPDAPHLVGVIADISAARTVQLGELRALEAAAEGARGRLAFLLDASAALDSTLEPTVILQQLARLCVPTLGDQCLVDTFDGELLVEAAAVALDPRVEEGLRELRRRWPPTPDRPNPALRVLRTRAPELFEEIPDELWTRIAQSDEHLDTLRAVAPRSGVTVPLVARGRVLGAMSIGARESGRVYGAGDVTLMEEVGRRAGLALDNARLYTDQATVAAELQRALLPPQLPRLDDLEVTARYLAAGVSEVGGDFYDAVLLGDGSLLVAVGDVAGKGPRAAALTGVARHSLRAIARSLPEPGGLLAALDRALRDDAADDALCTVVVALVTRDGGAVEVRFALGGHPSPIVVRRDGATEPVGIHAPLLGAGLATGWPESTLVLRPGDSLVMYTDGVTERRRGRELLGEDRLRRVLSATAGASAEVVADAVVGEVRNFSSAPLADDLAVLVMRVPRVLNATSR
jgi:serine phosphatase RsbU (regulator of sigma subunit)